MQRGIYVVDNRYFEAVKAAFGSEGIFLPSVTCPDLAEPVVSHPDMVLYPDGTGTVICAPQVFEAYSRILSPLGINLVQGKKALVRDYPGDVAYNVLRVSDYAFARWDCADEEIIRLLDVQHVNRLHIAQGYSRCSALAVGDGVITSDSSIVKAAQHAGLEALTIQPGFIGLPGYGYGFIGGASGILNEKTVVFFGDLNTHPDGQAIRQFITSRGFLCRDLPKRPLIDVGTILCVGYA